MPPELDIETIDAWDRYLATQKEVEKYDDYSLAAHIMRRWMGFSRLQIAKSAIAQLLSNVTANV